MSRENIDLVRRAVQAVYTRPRPDFETINAVYHPDHVLASAWSTTFGEGESRGARGFKAWLEETERSITWDGEIDGVIDVGPHTVLVASTLTMRGASSGAEGQARAWMVVRVSDGKVIRTETYTDPAEALDAVRPAK